MKIDISDAAARQLLLSFGISETYHSDVDVYLGVRSSGLRGGGKTGANRRRAMVLFLLRLRDAVWP